MAVRCFYPIFTANKKQELMNTGKWLLCLCLFTLIINSAAATDKCAGNDQRAFPMITIPDTIQKIDRRALYLAEHYDLEAVAYNATIPDILKKKIRNISREFLARVKLFIDFMGFEE